ncbi:MAG: helix-turn-helix domain-containing protein [Endozoicomonadaceae bacterium]|nr:helix-turn-helix domain-containing protein [Endozoicomonadaceae bacterium]
MLIIRVTSFYQQKKENDMAYQHLTAEERSQIYILLSKHYSIHAIGIALKRSPSTISREILHNTKGRKYCYQQAHQLAKERRLKASRQPYKILSILMKYIDILIKKMES